MLGTSLKLAACVDYLFAELPVAEQWPAMHSAGFGGVEWAYPFGSPADETARRLVENDLVMTQIHISDRIEEGVFGSAGTPGMEAEFRTHLDRGVRYAAAIGRPMICCLAGHIPQHAERGPYLDTLVANLAFAADEAAKAGIIVTMEPVCHYRIPDYLITTMAQGADVVARVGRPNFKLVFDTFHVRLEGDMVAETFERHVDDIALVQIANPLGRVEPGAGELDMHYFIERVRATGWDKWMSCEYRPTGGDTSRTLGWAKRYGIG